MRLELTLLITPSVKGGSRCGGEGPGGGNIGVERVHDRGRGVGRLPRASGPMGSEGGNQNLPTVKTQVG